MVGLVRVNRKTGVGLSTFQGVIRLGWISRLNSSFSPDKEPKQLNNLASNSSPVPVLSCARLTPDNPTDGLNPALRNWTFVLVWLAFLHNHSIVIQSASEVGKKHYTYDYISDFFLPWKSVFTKTLASLKWLHSRESYPGFSLPFPCVLEGERIGG